MIREAGLVVLGAVIQGVGAYLALTRGFGLVLVDGQAVLLSLGLVVFGRMAVLAVIEESPRA